MNSNSDGFDVVNFTLELESSAETFWKLLKRSQNLHITLSSFEVICSITKFLLENDELSEACVTKYTTENKVLKVSKKLLQSDQKEKNQHSLTANVFTNIDVKDKELGNEYLKPEVREGNVSTGEELNRENSSVGTSELVRQALLEAADIPDFTYSDISDVSVEKTYQRCAKQEKSYACSICQKTFIRPYLVRKHLENAHDKKEILQKGEQYIIIKGKRPKELFSHICSLCGKIFKEKRYLHNHYKFHVGQKRFACKICSRDFLWLCHTKKHVRDVHNKDDVMTNTDLYITKLTPLEDSSNVAVANPSEGNFENKEETTPFLCNYCKKQFLEKHILKNHLLQEHSFVSDTHNLPGIKSLPGNSGKHRTISNCKIQQLNEDTDVPVLSRKHKQSAVSDDETGDVEGDSQQQGLATNEARKSFNCSYCEKCFTEKILAELHIFLTHEQDRLDLLTDENGLYVCPVCVKKIGAKRNFKAHLHVHVKERYFICTICNKSFLWHSCATRHIKTHGFVDVNQYMKIVTSDNVINENTANVEQELPNMHGMTTCVQQGFSAEPGVTTQRDKSPEIYHLRVDKADVNLQVADYEVAAVDSVEGQGSVRERPRCTVCTRCCRGFMTHTAWKEHMNTCSVQNHYRCLICSVSFPTKCGAHRHVRRVHNKENDEIDQLVEEEEEDIQNGRVALLNDPEGSAASESHFMCSVCKKFFRERRYLRQHMWTHRRQWMHRCKHCARYFTKKQFLDEHILNRHPLGNMHSAQTVIENDGFLTAIQDVSDSHLCAVCGDPNADITPEGHMCQSCKEHKAAGDIFTCFVCGIQLKNKHDLAVHSRTHEVREHKCSVCGKIYKQKKLLDIHKKEHSGEKPFCCEACGLRFASSERLRFHNYNVHSERLRRNSIKFFASSLCPVCDLRVRIKDQMWNHLLIHSGTFELNCNYCDQFFTCTEELSTHGHSLHTNTDVPFVCFLCQAKFSEKANLLEHFRIHSDKEVHSCTQCSNTFYLKADLREHTKSKHERKKRNTVQEQALAGVYRGPFPCKMCGRVYQKKASLDIHMKIHYGIFDFPCDFCEKKFKSAAECRIHRRQHTKEKPYQCPYCGERFNRHSTLTQHKRRHTDERPYLCDDCGMAFRTRKTLQNHKMTHTKSAGTSQKSIAKVPPKNLPAMDSRTMSLPQHIEHPQQVQVMHQPDVNHYYSYWNVPRQ